MIDHQSKDNLYWQIVWTNFRKGDSYAFREIYNKYVDSLYAYGTKLTTDFHLVKDCIHDLFVELSNSKSNLTKPDNVEYYLMKSLKRQIINKIERNLLGSKKEEAYSFTMDISYNMEDEIILGESVKEKSKVINDILGSLDDRNKELLFLRFYSELEYNEIAEIIGIKPDSVKKQLFRILNLLREKYSDKIVGLLHICFTAPKTVSSI